MSAPASPNDPEVGAEMPRSARDRPREVGTGPGSEPVSRGGRAEARRVTSAGIADLAERQADAMAALDRALEARLGEFDRAFASRRTHLEGRLSEAENSLAEAIETGVAAFKRTAGDERRLLHEEAAAQLQALGDAVRKHVQEIEDTAATQLASLRRLVEQVQEPE